MWFSVWINTLAISGLAIVQASPALDINADVNVNADASADTPHLNVRDIGPINTLFFDEILGNVTALLTHDANVLTCAGCKGALAILKAVSHLLPQIFEDTLSKTCQGDTKYKGFCASKDHYDPSFSNIFNFIPDLRNMLELMDPLSSDGDSFCHFLVGGLCPLPAPPAIDFDSYWPPEPKNISKPQSKGKTFRVTHVSDIHLSLGYKEGAEAECAQPMCCVKEAFALPGKPSMPAPKFGYYLCDAPPVLMESSLANLANTTSSEFSIFTGDLVDHDPAFISKDQSIDEEVSVLKSLKAHLGDIPVYITLGNHDTYPYAQLAANWTGDQDRFTYNTELMAELWRNYKWLPEDSLNQASTHYGAFAVTPKPGLKVISLNSNFWFTYNFYNYADINNPDKSGMLQFLIDELVDAENRGLKAWVIAHVPTGGETTEALPGPAALFNAALTRFSKTVTGVFFGHTHLDEFTVYYKNGADKNGDNALGVAWVAPSVTPFTNLNPAWRYYEVDEDTYEIIDSRTYYSQIDKHFNQPWDTTGDLEWGYEYSARDFYTKYVPWPATAPLNGTFWHNVATTIFANNDTTADYLQLSYRHSLKTPSCDDQCRHDKLCYATSMTTNEAADCQSAFKGKRRQDFHAVPGWPMPRSGRI